MFKSRIDEVLKNDIINLEVVHISRPNSFYGQILNEKKEQLKQLFWNTDELTVGQKLTEAPKVGDLILAQYAEDHFWYRAKVIDIKENTNFQVSNFEFFLFKDLNSLFSKYYIFPPAGNLCGLW